MTTQLEFKTPLSQIRHAWILRNERIFPSMILPEIFTADDVRRQIEHPPKANWHGCFIAALKNTGRIISAGRVRSKRPERNGAKIEAWRRT